MPDQLSDVSALIVHFTIALLATPLVVALAFSLTALWRGMRGERRR